MQIVKSAALFLLRNPLFWVLVMGIEFVGSLGYNFFIKEGIWYSLTRVNPRIENLEMARYDASLFDCGTNWLSISFFVIRLHSHYRREIRPKIVEDGYDRYSLALWQMAAMLIFNLIVLIIDLLFKIVDMILQFGTAAAVFPLYVNWYSVIVSCLTSLALTQVFWLGVNITQRYVGLLLSWLLAPAGFVIVAAAATPTTSTAPIASIAIFIVLACATIAINAALVIQRNFRN